MTLLSNGVCSCSMLVRVFSVYITYTFLLLQYSWWCHEFLFLSYGNKGKVVEVRYKHFTYLSSIEQLDNRTARRKIHSDPLCNLWRQKCSGSPNPHLRMLSAISLEQNNNVKLYCFLKQLKLATKYVKIGQPLVFPKCNLYF